MAIEEIHVGDIGTSFELTISDTIDGVTALVDVSTATLKTITFLKPDGTKVTQSASFVTDGTDGKINYVTILDDLSVAGSWKLQGKVTLPTGSWNTDTSKFKVYSNL